MWPQFEYAVKKINRWTQYSQKSHLGLFINNDEQMDQITIGCCFYHGDSTSPDQMLKLS